MLWFWVVLRLRRRCGARLPAHRPDVRRLRAAEQQPLRHGGLLAMLTNSLMPFAFERGGALAGAATAVGFCVSLLGTS